MSLIFTLDMLPVYIYIKYTYRTQTFSRLRGSHINAPTLRQLKASLLTVLNCEGCYLPCYAGCAFDGVAGLLLSPDLLLSISFMPSATRTAGLDSGILQNSIWALTASSIPSWLLLCLLSSSLTASEHKPQSHFPPKLPLTLSMYSWVQSSLRLQQAHLTDSISIFSAHESKVCEPAEA